MSSQQGVSGSALIGLVSNPGSGSNRKQLQRVTDIVANCPQVLHRSTDSIAGIEPVLTEFAAEKIDVLAINGGDGTVSAVLTTLLHGCYLDPLPAIAVLPGGTTNMNARDINGQTGLVRAAERLCGQDLSERTVVNRPLLGIDRGEQGGLLCGMFFGAGAIINGIEYCRDEVHARGVGSEVGPGLALARTVWGMLHNDPRFAAPLDLQVRCDGADLTLYGASRILLVTSLERLFLGMRPWWGSQNGPLHLTLVEQRATGFLQRLPGVLRGAPAVDVNAATGWHSANVSSSELFFNGSYTLDGEIYSTRSIDRPLRLFCAGHLRCIRL